jgi:transcriptional regulator GlxA family with amidase domain
MTLLHRFLALSLAALCAAAPLASTGATAPPSDAGSGATEQIAPYVPRFGRTQPLVAVIGENGGTVLADFALPYGVLAAAAVADVVSVSTHAGVLKLGPVQIRADHTAAEFDTRYPEGADYVFVPAVSRHDDPVLAAWVQSQAAKGATLISICNGSLVLAHAGLTRGHRATGHWSTHKSREKAYPETRWVKNTRYVADGKIVSSAGITAAMPTAVALVEAIGGRARAEEVAKRIGLSYWGARHDSDAFRITVGDYVVGIKNSYLDATQTVGIAVADGVDEMALALMAEAYADTLRNEVHIVARTPAVRTRGGLLLVPDTLESRAPRFDIMLSAVDSVPAAQVPDKVLKDIAARYGPRTARFVVLDWEYPATDR